jgi:hypothetical protein
MPPAAPSAEPPLAARTRARHAEIHAALARGLTITEISGALRLDRKTVRRYAAAASPDQLISDTRLARPGLPGTHQAELRQRWDEGVRSTERLYGELRDRGYLGSLRTLRRLTARLRQDIADPAPPPAPAARKVAAWILTPPGKLTDDDSAALARITARCPELTATRDLVRGFADMLCHQRGEHLEAWTAGPRTALSAKCAASPRGSGPTGSRHRRTHHALQLRPRRRPHQPHQDDQETDVRPSQTRPAPQAHPARRLTNPHGKWARALNLPRDGHAELPGGR